MSDPTCTEEKISIGAYILERLAQLQVTALFGVPGDYNLVSGVDPAGSSCIVSQYHFTGIARLG